MPQAISEIQAVLNGESEGCIIQGDCLEIMADMPDGCVDLVLTDPPYGHNNNNGDMIANREAIYGGAKKVAESEYRPIANDGPEANDMFCGCMELYAKLLSPGCCCCCCCGGGGPDPQFARWALWMDEHIPFKMMVVWDKGPMGMGHHYRRSYETVLVSQVTGKCRWFDSSRKVENIIRPGQYGIKKIIPSASEHPCAKPVNLYAHFIRLHTAPRGIVLDPFAGHGPCAVAAKKLGRRWIGIEIDEKYCEIARRRIVNTPRPLFQDELKQEKPQLALFA